MISGSNEASPFKWALCLAAVLVLGLSACSSTEEPAPAPEPTDSEFDDGVVSEPTEKPQAASSVKLDTVYFDYDKASIRDDARVVLRSNADAISGAASGTVTIEGHCDERGSEEFNLALGERRAASVKRYLSNLGVPTNRMRTISYGEAKPAVQGHDESAWRWNRRAQFRSGS